MTKIFEFTTVKSAGGKSTRDTFSNRYDILMDDDVSSDNVAENAAWLIDQEKTVMLSEVYFQRCHIKQRADNQYNTPDRTRFKTVVSEERGARNVVFTIGQDGKVVNPMMPTDTCAVLGRDTAEGRAGKVMYRMCLLQADVTLGADGVWNLVGSANGNAASVLTALAAKFSLAPGTNGGLPHGQFCIPNKVDTIIENFVGQSGRPVIHYRVSGVQTLDRNRQRKSLAQVDKNAAQRHINDFKRQAEQAVRGKPLAELAGDALTVYNTIKAAARAYYAALPTAEKAIVLLPELLA